MKENKIEWEGNHNTEHLKGGLQIRYAIPTYLSTIYVQKYSFDS